MMRLRMAVAAASAATLSGLSCIALGSGIAAADPDCPALYVVAIPGTWETGKAKSPTANGRGMLAGVTDGLPRSTHVTYVDYPATAFPWEGDIYSASKKQAVRNARAVVGAMAQRCAATQIALVGYSQGADAAGDLAAEIGTGQGVVPPDRIAGVGLLSDPSRSPSDTQIGQPVGGTGAAGVRASGFGMVTDRVRTICAQGDLYCSTDDHDYLMRLAGYLARQDTNPGSLWGYGLQAASVLVELRAHGGISALQSQLDSESTRAHAQQLAKFYAAGTHESYGTYQVGDGQTATGWMHNWISALAD
ncbi:cutinase family protein [Nocardia sp. NPDC052112]|uniref:cutinase family protein n=1 Tax=Nocardia sp. NPDC052112 TaxID=3155646 RepID=UPI00344263C3